MSANATCRCGNIARHNDPRCGRCIDADDREAEKSELMDKVENAALNFRPGSFEAQFADAVVMLLRDARERGSL